MEPITPTNFLFDTPVGNVKIFLIPDYGWVFEFKSGFNNGLHNDVPFKTFDKCYTYIKRRLKDWNNEMNTW